MLSKRLMINIGVALAPITVVVLDTLLVGPHTSDELALAVRSSAATPLIAWIVALFMGHWFHPIDKLKPLLPLPWNYVLFVGLTVIVGLLSFLVIDTQSVSDWFPTSMFVAGFVAGSLTWPV